MCPEVLPTSCGRASGFILRIRRSSRPRGCWQYLLACSEYQLVRPLTAQYCSLTAARVPFVALSFFIRALRVVIENVLQRCKSLQLSSRKGDCGKFWALSTEFPTGLLNSCRVLCLARWDPSWNIAAGAEIGEDLIVLILVRLGFASLRFGLPVCGCILAAVESLAA